MPERVARGARHCKQEVEAFCGHERSGSPKPKSRGSRRIFAVASVGYKTGKDLKRDFQLQRALSQVYKRTNRKFVDNDRGNIVIGIDRCQTWCILTR